MTQGTLRKLWLHTSLFHHDVAAGIGTFWYYFVGDIGDRAEQCGHLFLGVGHLLLQFLVFLFQQRHLLFGFLCFFALALFHQIAYLCGHLFGMHLGVVEFALGFTSALVHGKYVLYCLSGTIEMFFLQTGYHPLCLFADKFKCKHNY